MSPIRTPTEYRRRGVRRGDRRGTTMVELIVTFALLCMFLVATAAILSASYQSYAQIRAADLSQQVSEIVLDKISGQIAGARADSGRESGSVVISDSSDPLFGVTTDSDPNPHNCIALQNSENSAVYLTLTDYSSNPELEKGYLLIHYRAVPSQKH